MLWKLKEPATPCSFLGKLQSFILRVESILASNH